MSGLRDQVGSEIALDGQISDSNLPYRPSKVLTGYNFLAHCQPTSTGHAS